MRTPTITPKEALELRKTFEVWRLEADPGWPRSLVFIDRIGVEVTVQQLGNQNQVAITLSVRGPKTEGFDQVSSTHAALFQEVLTALRVPTQLVSHAGHNAPESLEASYQDKGQVSVLHITLTPERSTAWMQS